jgi:hypothetical protein
LLRQVLLFDKVFHSGKNAGAEVIGVSFPSSQATNKKLIAR